MYSPTGVPGATVIVPSGFITKAGSLGVPGVKIISDGLTGLPFNLSLSNTLGVVPPVLPSVIVKLSSIASMSSGTTTITIVVSQMPLTASH